MDRPTPQQLLVSTDLLVKVPMSLGGQNDALGAAAGDHSAYTRVTPIEQPSCHRDHLPADDHGTVTDVTIEKAY